jgi:lipopolysaccharide cholinephosphotransferase
VIKICQEHHINYSLCGGSVVGAHLYKGFIPWDDDIDLMMTRDNYNRFIEIAEDHLPKGFAIWNYQNGKDTFGINYTKIINENTTFVQKNGKVTGIFLDITVYDKVPENMLKYVDLFLYKRAMTINTGRLPGSGFKNTIRNIMLCTLLSNRIKYLKFFQKTVELISKCSNHYTYRELFGAFYYINMFSYKSTIFENYINIVFEGRTVKIVRDYIEYLQIRFNRTDFNEPKDKQVPSHLAYVDFEMPYKEYILKNRSITTNK